MKKFLSLLTMLCVASALSAQVDVIATSGVLGSSYSGLKSAFDNINNGSHQGNIEIIINADITETATASLNASGSGSANYSDVRIYPSGGVRSISGNLNAALILLNGADNVIIDGLNTGGNALIIENSNTGLSATAVTLNNDACYNTVRNCTLKGSTTATSSGVLYFGNTGPLTGNDNNVISDCEITCSGINYPSCPVYSTGSVYFNSQNTIIRCNISNFRRDAGSAVNAAINLASYNMEWTIAENNIFQTAAISFTNSNVRYCGISISGGASYIIRDNCIGFASPYQSGRTEINVSNSGFLLQGIYLSGNNSASNILENNQVSDITVNAASNAITFNGLHFYTSSAQLNLNVTGNTIGSVSQSDKLLFNTTGSLIVRPVFFDGSNHYTATISNNYFGSVSTGSNNPSGCYFYGIYLNGNSSSSFSVNSNIIGTATAPISPGTSTATGQYQLFGISSSSIGNVAVDGNTISYLYENSTGNVSFVMGITIESLSSSLRTFTNNTISHLISRSGYAYRSAVGIQISSWGSTGGVHVVGNNIHNIRYVHGAAVRNSVSGISVPGGTQCLIASNKIYDIDNNSTYAWASYAYNREGIYGIEMNNSANSSYAVEIYNNLIYLSAAKSGNICVPVHGIDVHSLSKVYYNTVVITGTACGNASSVPTCAMSGGQYLEIPVYNNIFANYRSGNGMHCAIINDGYTSYTTTNYTFFTNYNLYYTSNASTMGKWSTSARTFAQWKASVYNSGTGPNVDQNSVYSDPLLNNVSDTGAAFNFYPTAVSPALDMGVYFASALTDYTGLVRDVVSPDVGAYEMGYVWSGQISDDWNTPANWVKGSVPGLNATIMIPANGVSNHCVMDGDKTISDLYSSNAACFLSTGSHVLTVKGNLILSGGSVLNAQNGKLVFQGTAQQHIPSGAFNSGTLNSLEIANPAGLSLGGALTISSELTLTTGTLTTSGLLSVGNNATININGGYISETPLFAGLADFYYMQNPAAVNTAEELPSAQNVIRNLVVATDNGVVLKKDITINGRLDLLNGSLDIRSNNLNLAPGADIINYTASRYIIAGDNDYSAACGRLSRFINNTTPAQDQLFPVGTTMSYTPCSISTQNTTGTVFRINVFGKVLVNGTSGNELTSQTIYRTWDIVPVDNADAGPASLTLFWNPADEAGDFDRNIVGVWKNRHVPGIDENWSEITGNLTNQSNTIPYWVKVDGITTFSNFTAFSGEGGPFSPLPVNLRESSVECIDGTQMLKWITASETSNDYFTVERSTDAMSWTVAAVLKGAGYSNTAETYAYRDDAVDFSGFYRLSQTDYDGKTEVLCIHNTVPCSENLKNNVFVSPNPFKRHFFVTVHSENEANSILRLYDPAFRLVFEKQICLNRGANTILTEPDHLLPGIYVLVIGNKTIKLIHQAD